MKISSVTAAGGVLYKLEEGVPKILLIFRRGVWDLPKGKLEEGESIEECARREVGEEVGCTLPIVSSKLNTTYHEYRQNGETIGKTTHWYAMQAPQVEKYTPQKLEGITKVAWYPIEEANRIVGFENLRSVIVAFKKWQSRKG